MAVFHTSRIIARIRENDLVATFSIDPVPDPFQDKKPGQYLILKLPQGDSWTQGHPFTITSGPGETPLTITVKKIGPFTAALHGLDLPSSVQVTGPLGTFGKDIEQEEAVVYLAGGIGITPFLSLLKHQKARRASTRILLFWANHRPEDFFGLPFLKEAAAGLNMEIVLVFGQYPETEGKLPFICHCGLLTTDLFARFPLVQNARILLCGSENMHHYVFSQLEPLGIQAAAIETEKVGIYMATQPPDSPA